MNNSNENKNKFLGMPYGTAVHRLKKNILFDLVKKANKNICFRCGLEIETPKDLSIDHKTPWLDIDIELFWDIDNIAFSHNSCNSASHTTKGGVKRRIIPKGKAWCHACRQFVDEKIIPNNRSKYHGKGSICNPCRKKTRNNG